MKIIIFATVLTFISWASYAYPKNYVEEVFYWKKVKYENLPKSSDDYKDNYYVGPYKYYIPENNDIIGTGYHTASGLMIVVILRSRPGVPITLGGFCVNDYKHGTSPKIWGFPDYQTNTLRDSDFASGPLEDELKPSKSESDSYSIQDDDVRKGSIKPNKHNKGDNHYNYNHNTGGHSQVNNHGNHHYIHQIPLYQTPFVPPPEVPSEPARIISVFYQMIDEMCNRLYAMDNGQVQYFQNSTYPIQKPALIIIDLPSNGCETRNFPFIRRSELPDKISAKGADGFMALAVDYQDKASCEDPFVYIPNAFHGYLVVYNYKNDEFWHFDHETFQPIIAESHMIFDKTFEYDLPLGIDTISLGYPDENGDRTAYYSPLAGTAQYAVSTSILKNRRRSPMNYSPDDFRIMGYLGCDHQRMRTVIDYSYGVMFFGEAQSNQVRCWNINKPLNPDYIDVVYESKDLLFTLDISIDSRGYLWFHTAHIPIDFLTDQPLNLQEVNSRTYRVKVSDAIRGTVCEN